MKLIFSVLIMLAALAHAGGFEFAETSKKVEIAPDAANVTIDFPFTNKSDQTVTITSSQGDCSCLKAEISEGKLKYAPGESGIVRATFETGNYSGTVQKMIKISLASGPTEERSMVDLSLEMKIPALINLEPRTLQWGIGEKAEPKTIKISISEGQTIHATGVNSSSEEFAHELKKIKEGKEYELVITPKTTDNTRLAVFRIETDCSIAKYRVQQAFGIVKNYQIPRQRH
ncbi:MAG: DUF1573 domain-containing protein [Akkermansiaceae bacterium]|nr:DUF1573 domain-containing protein [Akkermansiaceae bacterium]